MEKAAFKLFENTDNTPKFPYREGIAGPWNNLFSNWRRFLILGIGFSLLLTLVALICGQAFVCSYRIYGDVNFYCSENESITLFYILIKLILMTSYIYIWVNYDSLISEHKKEYVKGIKQIAISSGLLFIMLIFTLLPLVSFMFLSERVPNPDWRIESLYFTFVSLGFFSPFLMMRFMQILGFSLEGEKIPPLKELWRSSKGNMLRIIFTLFVLFLVYTLFYSNFYGNFRQTEAAVMPVAGVIIELLYNFILLFFFTLFINNILLQKKYLYDKAQNEAEA